ncbi:hypothetical protein JX265_008500 [Neoarthrinium moseri]|uniref:Uncharacterized protein n=1 Tax=Neoarthrinium moseri TaxID=1658444 RepID=A0A9P9WID3_9PEZI|nr:hypothetical protein JX265_008500 [Neoarthrinium moseri]
MVFGCSASQRRQFEARLAKASSASLAHPLLIPGIFAELERKRLSERVEDTLDRFTLRTNSVSDSPDRDLVMLDMNEEQMSDYLQLCYESQSLAKELKIVKRQLAKMVQFCDDFKPSSSAKHQTVLRSVDQEEILANENSIDVINVNKMLKARILEIMDEYDDKIEECNMIMDNMSITMQTVWSHIARRDAIVNTNIARANNSIALDAKQDNGQMKSIAFLTMFYLPVSAVASIFSMSMFDWSPSEGSVVSDSLWVFILVATVLTALTLLVWQIVTCRQKRKASSRDRDLEVGYAADQLESKDFI